MMVWLETFLPVLIPGLVLVLWYLRSHRRFTVARLLMVVLFMMYVLQVVSHTVFPLRFDNSYIDAHRSHTRFLDGVNLLPFKDLSSTYLTSVQGWGNVVLGVPFGLLYPFVFPISGWRRMALRGLLLGVAIEFTQLFISLLYGFAYRVIDVNDIILNWAGAMTGYALLRGVAALYWAVAGRSSQETRSQNQGPWTHIRSVLFAQRAA